MKTSILLAVAATSVVVSSVSAVVVPNDRATTLGGSSFFGPITSSVRRIQLLIDSSQLTASLGQQITGMNFRLASSASTPFPATTSVYPDYEIYLGASVDPTARTLSFSANRAGPLTQVRDGSLTIPANAYSATGSPAPFGPTVNFDSPYIYAGGDLMVEIVHTGSTGPSTSADAVNSLSGTGNGYGVLFSSVWASNLTVDNAINANFTVVNLVTGAVPEPASLGLIAAAGLFSLRRRR